MDGTSLTIQGVESVARLEATVALSSAAAKRVAKCHRFLERMVDRGDPIYGVTTGVGDFAKVRISRELGSELQRRIVVSHSAGFGDPKPVEAVRAAMLCRANTLAKGLSAVRLETLSTYIELINGGVTPVVYEKGSVGASGDLAPLCQIAEVLMGRGEAWYRGERIPGALALKKAGLAPASLTFKEGLALINGSQMMTGELALRCADAENLLRNAIIAAAMSIDALRCVRSAFDARIHEARPFPGQIAVAENVRRLTEGSSLLDSAGAGVQDAYSLRCAPQVLGASLDALAYVERQVTTEMNSAADNPLFFPEDGAQLAGGNFHGQPIAIAADLLAIALSEVASVSERRTNRLMNPALSAGLPDFLVEGKGLNSGLMGAQITAAALVSENKVLAHPGSVDSIPVAADTEDHVSMGAVSVRKLRDICSNVTGVVAIEMLSAAQALDFRSAKKAGAGVRTAHRIIRGAVEHLTDDRILHPDIMRVALLIASGEIVRAVERKAGSINLGSYPY
ncbi:MAG TPA: histidine ammonia-lyase [Candidatus Bathyarchaeia archaeon]|nr:histidine ammonia-lyase [Candidatus Bathyarchaeia archaeon]